MQTALIFVHDLHVSNYVSVLELLILDWLEREKISDFKSETYKKGTISKQSHGAEEIKR